jgi:FkbM family methyltransferase
MQRIPKTDIFLPDSETHLLRQKGHKRFWEGYQRDRVELACRHVKVFDTAVDIGAHVGLITRELAQRFKQVFAFEPDPEAFACLEANTKHLAHVCRFNCALGKQDGEIGLAASEPGNTGNRQVQPGRSGAKLRRLDGFDLPSLDLVKIDVQGYEFQVLQGAKGYIHTFAPVLIVEQEPPAKLAERFSKPGAADRALRSWNAVELGRISADVVYGFGKRGAGPYYDKYDRLGDYHWQKYLARHADGDADYVDEVVAYIRQQRHQRLLDIGCGDGVFTKLLDAVGVDTCPTAVKLARQHGADAHCLNAFRVRQLPGVFDAVALFDCFEHLHLQDKMLQRLHAVAPTLYILNPEPVGSGWHTREFTAEQLIDFAKEHGWALRYRQDFYLTKRNRKSLLHFTSSGRGGATCG